MTDPTLQQARIKAEAADWVAKLRSSDSNGKTHVDFDLWRRADIKHELAYEQCMALWSLTADLKQDADILRELNDARQLVQAKPANRNIGNFLQRLFWSKAFATASVVLMLGVAVLYHFPLSSDNYETRIGEQKIITLRDGSRVTLNTDTKISAKFSGKKRTIELLKGEAYFAVSKDKQRPFEVVTATGLVRAVGTEFNVNLLNHTLAIDVAEGVVQLEVTTSTNPQPQVITQLKVGEAVHYHSDDNFVRIEQANLQRINAWKSNKIYFSRNTLAEATAEYNRYIKERLVLVDNDLVDLRISGVFNQGDVDTFIFSLQRSLGLRVERKQGLILIMKK